MAQGWASCSTPTCPVAGSRPWPRSPAARSTRGRAQVRHAAAHPAGHAAGGHDHHDGRQAGGLLRDLDAAVQAADPACGTARDHGLGLRRCQVGEQEGAAAPQRAVAHDRGQCEPAGARQVDQRPGGRQRQLPAAPAAGRPDAALGQPARRTRLAATRGPTFAETPGPVHRPGADRHPRARRRRTSATRATATPRPGTCPRPTTSRPATPPRAPGTTSSPARRPPTTARPGDPASPPSSTRTPTAPRPSGTTTTRWA